MICKALAVGWRTRSAKGRGCFSCLSQLLHGLESLCMIGKEPRPPNSAPPLPGQLRVHCGKGDAPEMLLLIGAPRKHFPPRQIP